MTISERFWSKVQKTDTCWLFTGSKDRRGYGRLSTTHGKSPMKAHRVSWIIHNGEIPPGIEVCHKCDNPSCVNPGHLFLGTHKDNLRDAAHKKRIGNNPKSLANLHPGQRGYYGAGETSNFELGRV